MGMLGSGILSLNWPPWADSVKKLPCPWMCCSECVRHWVLFLSRPLIGPEVPNLVGSFFLIHYKGHMALFSLSHKAKVAK